MPLTPEQWTAEDEAEYQQLLAEKEREEGNRVADKVLSVHARTKPRPFSIIRTTAGMFRDAFQNVFDFVEDAGDELQRRAPLPVVRFGSTASNGLIDVIAGREAAEFTTRNRQMPSLPDLPGSEGAGTAERLARGIGSYLVPFVGWSKVFGVTKAAGWLGRSGRATAAGFATDFTAQDPQEANLANILRDSFGLDHELLDSLASEEDENQIFSRFKAAATMLPAGIAADAAIEGGVRLVKLLRFYKAAKEEALATVKAVQAEMAVRPANAADIAEGAAAGRAADEADPFAGLKAEAATVENADDVLAFLQRKAGEVDEAQLGALAKSLLEGSPSEALGRLGINPLKVDFSALDDADALARFHAGLREVYEGIAQRLGKTGIRLTEEATASAARSLATSADVLKDLYARTHDLAPVMYASQTLVGSHAVRLLSLANQALAALKTGSGSKEWLDFLQTFHRHAYFMGALRGAGTEIARSLRALQMVQKVGAKKAARTFDDAAKTEAERTGGGAKAAQVLAQAATDNVSRIGSEAERIRFLSRLIETGGDLEEMSRFTRVKAGSQLTPFERALSRIDGAVLETVGNLFSSATGVLNVGAGITMLGLRGVAKGLAGIGRMALSPLGKHHSMEARLHLLDAWAYVDGAMGAWNDAFRNAFLALEREGMVELQIALDVLGANGLARKAATLADEANTKIGADNFERIDMNARPRNLSMTAGEADQLARLSSEWSGSRVMEHSLRFLFRGLATAVNTTGSATRLGTILFINAADEFIGTLSSRAGAQSKALRLAAQEAAEAGLDGKELTEFLQARAALLAKDVDGFADDAFEAGEREAALAHGSAEAREILFQDPMDSRFMHRFSRLLGQTKFSHLVIPFRHTPFRILERSVIDFTPLGVLSQRLRADILAGGARRDEAIARMGLGTMMVYLAFSLAEERRIIGTDGYITSSARAAGRRSFTLKIGDDEVEFKRIDPLGTLLGWGADFNAYLKEYEDQNMVPPRAQEYLQAVLVATSANVLSKTYLQSLRDLTDLASEAIKADSGAGRAEAWGKFVADYAARFMPGSGLQRSAEKGIDGINREASGFLEGLLKASLGANKLPPSRDALGRLPKNDDPGDRVLSFPWRPASDDPLDVELERLSFDLPRPNRTQKGVELTSHQFSRWLELRGQELPNPNTGLTMEQTLRELITYPEYQQATRAGKIEMIRAEMQGFSRLATEHLLQEDDDFAARAIKEEMRVLHRIEGASPEARRSELEKLSQELGLNVAE